MDPDSKECSASSSVQGEEEQDDGVVAFGPGIDHGPWCDTPGGPQGTWNGISYFNIARLLNLHHGLSYSFPYYNRDYFLART